MGGAVGNVLGTVADIGLMGTNPFVAVAKTAALNGLQNAFAGGGDSPSAGGGSTPQYAVPEFNYGANTYTYGGNPYDASKYFITGDKGVYNLLPMLSTAYKDPNKTDMTTAGYGTYQSIYDKMKDDAAAQAAFAKAYGPQSYTYAPPPPRTNKAGSVGMGNTGAFGGIGGSAGGGNAYGLNFGGRGGSGYSQGVALKGLGLGPDPRKDLMGVLQNQFAAAKAYNSMPGGKGKSVPTTPYNYTPIQYVNYGMGSTDKLLADYAAQQKNPFFVPFAPKPATTTGTGTTTTTTTAPVNPVGSLNNPGQFQPVNVREGGIIGLLRN